MPTNTKQTYETYLEAVKQYAIDLENYVRELPEGAVDEGSNPPPPPPPPPPHG